MSVSVCVCVSMSVCMCMFVCVCKYACVYVYGCMCVIVSMRVSTCMGVCEYAYECVYACVISTTKLIAIGISFEFFFRKVNTGNQNIPFFCHLSYFYIGCITYVLRIIY